jgi:hypothetical protein
MFSKVSEEGTLYMSVSTLKPEPATVMQGLTLVHFSAQLERFVWDRGCM